MPEAIQPRRAVPLPAAQAAESQPKATILLVEDDVLVCSLLTEVLRRAGYEVLPCAHPDEGIAQSRGRVEAIDLLLTDVVMPGMNGREMADRILQHRPGLRIVFMSGYTEHILMDEGEIDTRFEYLQKPFTLNALTGKVATVLAQQVH